MKLFGAVLASAALGLAPMLAAGPAMAEGNDVLGQVQRFFNGNNSNEQNAYEQGRLDQQRQEQARHERWREQHAENYNENRNRYQQPYGNYETAPRYREGYNNRYNENQAYGGPYGPTYNQYGYGR